MNFHLDTPLARGLRTLFSKLDQSLRADQPTTAYLAGGMAVHLYTGKRVTTDVDAEFDRRLLIPTDLIVEISEQHAWGQVLYFDTQFNPMFSPLHEDYQVDALPLNLGLSKLDVRVLTPVDLAVSKLARFATVDREDITDLARLERFDAATFNTRAERALAAYAEPVDKVRLNLHLALAEIAGREAAEGC